MSDRKENGSITVEAALFIPMFLFAFMCIFSLISCVRAQVLIQYSVDQAAKEVAEYSYILEKTGVLDAYKGLNTKSEEFSKQMEDIKSNLEVIENTAISAVVLFSSSRNSTRAPNSFSSETRPFSQMLTESTMLSIRRRVIFLSILLQ